MRPTVRLRIAAAALLRALAFAPRAGACGIELMGAPDAAWEQAAVETREALRDRVTADCASIVVEVVSPGAVVRLAARDGRLAVRELHEPAELLPVIQALTVEGPGVALEPPSKRRRAESESGATPPSAAPRADAPRPLVGAVIGFRLGAGRLITPTVGGMVSILNQRLEVGLLARYESHYVTANGGNEDRPKTSGFVLGALIGLHHELDSITLRVGALGLVAALREERAGQQGRAEARLGSYVGGVWPTRGKLRLRGDLALEFVPYNIGHSETNALGASSLPWWACGFSMGVELG